MIGFAGLSHLGVNYSLATAAKGFKVLAFHPSEGLVVDLGNGKFPIEEPGLLELFAQQRQHIRYTANAGDLSECELVFVALDVKTDDANRSDTGPLMELIRLIAPHLRRGSTLVLLSQVNPGFTRKLRDELLRSSSVGEICYQVETLIFGRAVERALQPERYMVGANDPARPLPALFNQWHNTFGCPVLVMRYESAELAKIAINLFLVSSVSTANTLAEVCENIGADWNEIVPALRLDARIGPKAYLAPGLGIAGGNLERDLVTVQTLAAEHGTEAGVVSAWQVNSRYRRDWVLRKFHVSISTWVGDPRVAIWGLAYKPNTHSVKNSPALALIESLALATKTAFDPQARLDPSSFPKLQLAASAIEACRDADVLIIMTAWPEFSKVDFTELKQVMAGNVIIDPYCSLDPSACRQAGFSHQRLGTPSPA